MCTKLLDSLLPAKYLISVTAALNDILPTESDPENELLFLVLFCCLYF